MIAAAVEDPAAAHARARAERARQAERAARADRLCAHLRLTLGLATLAAAGLALGGWMRGWWILPPLAAFVVVARRHDGILRRLAAARRGEGFHARALDRLRGAWPGVGDDGLAYEPAQHPYAEDLDILGPGSLFQRLGMTGSEAGRRTLAGWLLAPAAPTVVRERQAAIAELRSLLEWREELAVASGEEGVAGRAMPAARCDDASPVPGAPAAPPAILLRVAAALIGTAGLTTLVGWWFLGTGVGPLLGVLVPHAILALALRARARRAAHALEAEGDSRQGLADLCAGVEAARFTAPLLRAHQGELAHGRVLASARLRARRRLADRLEWRRNPFFAPFAGLGLWTTQIALAEEAWQAEHAAALPRWQAAAGAVEALAALAQFAFEHPGDPFPVLEEPRSGTTTAARFLADGLTHPILPAARAVANDIRLDATGVQLLMVSGANMAGKTTLLRAVGVNAVLAQAGSTVRAASLVLSPLAIGASLRVRDSLLEGTSRFLAEIRTLRRLQDAAAGPPPLLFLLDEPLAGTNATERREGANGILRALLGRGALGMVTTHDASLVEIAAALSPRALNVHLRDEVREGHLHFDYLLRPGVSPHGNALLLMRDAGLEV